MDHTLATHPTDYAGITVRRVEQLREARGVSVRTVADETGIPLTTLQRRLAGRQPFTVEELGALADYFDTTVADLVVEVAA